MKDDFEQLSIFDVILKKPEADLIENKDELPTQSVTTERHTDNLCPYAVPTIKEIVKLIDDSCIFHDKDSLFRICFAVLPYPSRTKSISFNSPNAKNTTNR